MTDFLPVNSIVSDTLGEFGDYYSSSWGYYDVYQLTGLTSGVTVAVGVASNDFDTYLRIYNSGTGQLVASNDDGGIGSNSQLAFTPILGNSYQAYVSGYYTDSTGFYSIGVST